MEPTREMDGPFEEILAEHKRIRTLIGSARDAAVPIAERRRRVRGLVELVQRHARAEEHSLYGVMLARRAVALMVLENQEAHEWLDKECSRLLRTSDDELWESRLRLVADLLERHLRDEERILLPKAALELSAEDIEKVREEYLRVMAGLRRARGPLVTGRAVDPGPPIEIEPHHPKLPVGESPSWGLS